MKEDRMKRTSIAAIIAVVASAAAGMPAFADDAAALTTSIQTLDASATTRSPGAVSGRIAGDFQNFAGSNTNSTSLVEGLRTGSAITLTAPNQPSATFAPPTRPMGWGNVSTSLSLAQYQLAQQGITSPTPQQLQIALNGGTITANGQTVQYQGVLQMRASGLGWGEIAQASGTKLGPVISGLKTQSVAVSALPATPHATATAVAPAGQGVVSANGIASAGNGKTSAPGQAKASGGSAEGKGIVNASGGTSPGGGNGNANANGAAKGQGIVTGAGVVNAGGANVAAGGTRGVTTAAGVSSAGGNGNGKALGQTK
jgi:hypothetical protein